MLLKMRAHMLLKDGKKGDTLVCETCICNQEGEQGSVFRRVVRKLCPLGVILQGNENFISEHDNCVHVHVGT